MNKQQIPLCKLAFLQLDYFLIVTHMSMSSVADTIALNKGGKLVALLTEAGAISGSSSKTTVTA